MGYGQILIPGILISFFLGIVGAAEVKKLSPCKFPAIYNFGDSNSDTGGFSAAIIFVKPPTGKAYAGKPQKRMCDGRLIVDLIAEKLGLPHVDAYLDSIGTNYRKGANFAVAASTIRRQNDSFNYLSPFYFRIQTTQFTQFKARAMDIHKRGKKTSRLPMPKDFSKALYTIDFGHNDVVRSMYGLSTQEIPDMIDQFATGVKNLYGEGARTFWIHSTGPLGCLPSNVNFPAMTASPEKDEYGCLKSYNNVAIQFNNQLKDKLVKLRAELKEAAITYVDVYAAKYKLFSNAKQLGFLDPFTSCAVGNTTCSDPSKYITWDGVHLSEAANRLVAQSTLDGSLSDPPLPITHACYRDVSM